MRELNTENPVSVWDYEALITEIDRAKAPDHIKVRRLERAYHELSNAAWYDSYKALAQEQANRAYTLAQKYGGF